MRRVLIFVGLKVVEVGAALAVWVVAALVGQYTWLPYIGKSTDLATWEARWFHAPLVTLTVLVLVILLLGFVWFVVVEPN